MEGKACLHVTSATIHRGGSLSLPRSRHWSSPLTSPAALSLFACRPPDRAAGLLAAVPLDLRRAALQNPGARLRNVSAKRCSANYRSSEGCSIKSVLDENSNSYKKLFHKAPCSCGSRLESWFSLKTAAKAGLHWKPQLWGAVLIESLFC